MDRAIPQLPARSMTRTLAFFRALGFETEVASPGGDYAFAERGDLEIHFFLHEGLDPATSSFGCYLRVDDVEAVHRAFRAAGLPAQGIPRLTPPVDTPWGMREFALVDENGSLVRVGQVIAPDPGS